MSDENENDEKPREKLFIGLYISKRETDPNDDTVAFYFTRGANRVQAAMRAERSEQYHGSSVLYEVPERYERVMEAVLRMITEGAGDGDGPVLFAALYEKSEGGFDARTLTTPMFRLGGFDDIVHMAASGDMDCADTPGTALAALGAGIDRVLALGGWRERFGYSKFARSILGLGKTIEEMRFEGTDK